MRGIGAGRRDRQPDGVCGMRRPLCRFRLARRRTRVSALPHAITHVSTRGSQRRASCESCRFAFHPANSQVEGVCVFDCGGSPDAETLCAPGERQSVAAQSIAGAIALRRVPGFLGTRRTGFAMHAVYRSGVRETPGWDDRAIGPVCGPGRSEGESPSGSCEEGLAMRRVDSCTADAHQPDEGVIERPFQPPAGRLPKVRDTSWWICGVVCRYSTCKSTTCRKGTVRATIVTGQGCRAHIVGLSLVGGR